MNAYTLKYKTNLAVFSFPNAFLNFKNRKKKESRHIAIPETPIYNYIYKYVHTCILLSFVKLLHSAASIGHY